MGSRAVQRQIETAGISRRRGEGVFMRVDRKRRGTAAVSQRHLVLAALPVPERKYPLPSSNGHPARNAPWRMRFNTRGFLLVLQDRRNRGAKLEIAGRGGVGRQVLQFALDKAGIDGV